MCLDDNDNAHITICGERYFLGNMCCPSTTTSGVGLCGNIRITAESGHPQIDTDGNWSCCPSFAYDVVPVHGQSARPDNYRQTLCCPQNDKAYYDINTGSARCCPGSNQPLLQNKVDGVQGYNPAVSARHCCPADTDAYWNGSSVQCCDGKVSCTTFNGQKVCRCCEEGENLYAYYPDYLEDYGEVDLGAVKLGCCVNDPLTSFMGVGENSFMDMPTVGQLCCPASKPVYHLRSSDVWSADIYDCFEGTPQIVSGFGYNNENTGMIVYEYCPNGYSNWVWAGEDCGDPPYSPSCARSCL